MGIVQGLTEFLPISSSGHLIIVPYLFGWDDPFIDVARVQRDAPHRDAGRAAHLLRRTTGSGSSRPGSRRSAIARSAGDPDRKLAWLLAGRHHPGRHRRLPLQRRHRDRRPRHRARRGDARGRRRRSCGSPTAGVAARRASRTSPSRSPFGLGAAQALALIPGISRSGISISAAASPVSTARPPRGSASSWRRRSPRARRSSSCASSSSGETGVDVERRPAHRRDARRVHLRDAGHQGPARLPAHALAQRLRRVPARARRGHRRRLAARGRSSADGGHEAAPPASDPRPGRAAADPDPAGARRPPSASAASARPRRRSAATSRSSA